MQFISFFVFFNVTGSGIPTSDTEPLKPKPPIALRHDDPLVHLVLLRRERVKMSNSVLNRQLFIQHLLLQAKTYCFESIKKSKYHLIM